MTIKTTIEGADWAAIQVEAASIAGMTVTTTTVTTTKFTPVPAAAAASTSGSTAGTAAGATSSTAGSGTAAGATSSTAGSGTAAGATSSTAGSGTAAGATSSTAGSGTAAGPTAAQGGAADGNVYPLKMPPGITGGAPVNLGVGPNSLTIAVANNPGSGVSNEFVVLLNRGSAPQVSIAGPFNVTSDVGESLQGSQVFTINGDFTGATGFQLVPIGNGMNGLWVEELSLDYVLWFVDFDAANSRGTGSPNYQSGIAFNSNGTSMLYLPKSAVPAAPIPVPNAVATSVAGSTVTASEPAGGAPSSPATALLSALIAGTPAGSTLTLPAGTIIGSSTIPNASTISGAGMGQTVISSTDFPVVENKSVLLPLVPGVTIENMTINGAQIPTSEGNNAAGLRDGGPGIGFIATNVELTGCQNGMLSFPSDITMTGCKTHGNGAGDGYTHELYFGGNPTNVVNLNQHTSVCGAGATHALKTRAGTTKVTGGSFTGSADTTGNIGGSVIDVPDTGIFEMTGATVENVAGTANTMLFGYGMETNGNAATGTSAVFTDVVFVDNTGTGGLIENGGANPQATLTLVSCTYTGTVAPVTKGWASVTGELTPAKVAA
jgi:hypothetical protein